MTVVKRLSQVVLNHMDAVGVIGSGAAHSNTRSHMEGSSPAKTALQSLAAQYNIERSKTQRHKSLPRSGDSVCSALVVIPTPRRQPQLHFSKLLVQRPPSREMFLLPRLTKSARRRASECKELVLYTPRTMHNAFILGHRTQAASYTSEEIRVSVSPFELPLQQLQDVVRHFRLTNLPGPGPRHSRQISHDSACCANSSFYEASEESEEAQQCQIIGQVLKTEVLKDTRIAAALLQQEHELESDFETALEISEQSHQIEIENLREDHAADIASLESQLRSLRRDAAKTRDRLRAKQSATAQELVQAKASVDFLNSRLQVKETANAIRSNAHDVAALTKELGISMLNPDQATRKNARLEERLAVVHGAYQTLGDRYDSLVESKLKLLERNRDLEHHVEAILANRAPEFAERDPEIEFGQICRPDQVQDLEKALLVSQQMHAKECALTAEQNEEMVAKAFELDEANSKIAHLGDELSALKTSSEISAKATEAYSSTMALLADPARTSDYDEQLERGLQVCLEQDAAMSQALLEKSVEAAGLRNENRAMKADHEWLVQNLRAQLAEQINKNYDLERDSHVFEFRAQNAEEELERLGVDFEAARNASCELQEQAEEHAFEPSTAAAQDIVDPGMDGKIQQLKLDLAFYERHTIEQEVTIQHKDRDYNLMLSAVEHELSVAHQWRKDRDIYRAKLDALENRYTLDLLLRPLDVDLTVAEPTSEELEHLNSINEALFYHFDIKIGKWKAENMPTESEYEKLLAAVKVEEAERLQEEKRDEAWGEQYSHNDWECAGPSSTAASSSTCVASFRDAQTPDPSTASKTVVEENGPEDPDWETISTWFEDQRPPPQTSPPRSSTITARRG